MKGGGKMKRAFVILMVVSLMCAVGGLAIAAEKKYPTKPITFIIPWGAGGMTDVSGRLLADKFKAELGQPVVVVNKPGASGVIGLRHTLRQKADGYTVCIGAMSIARRILGSGSWYGRCRPFGLLWI